MGQERFALFLSGSQSSSVSGVVAFRLKVGKNACVPERRVRNQRNRRAILLRPFLTNFINNR